MECVFKKMQYIDKVEAIFTYNHLIQTLFVIIWSQTANS